MQRFHGPVLYNTQRVGSIINKNFSSVFFSRINVTFYETICVMAHHIYRHVLVYFRLCIWIRRLGPAAEQRLHLLAKVLSIFFPTFFCLKGNLFFIISLLREESNMGGRFLTSKLLKWNNFDWLKPHPPPHSVSQHTMKLDRMSPLTIVVAVVV